jgi:hypothetical protein
VRGHHPDAGLALAAALVGALAVRFVLSRCARLVGRRQVGRAQRHRVLATFRVDGCDPVVVRRSEALARLACKTSRAWLPLVGVVLGTVAYAATH